MSGPGIDHVQLAAPPGCEAQVRRFYGDVIGLVEIGKPEAASGSASVPNSCTSASTPPFSPAHKAHPGLRVAPNDLDALAQRLHTAGAVVTWDNNQPGVRRFYTHDPWANRLELLAET